MLRTITLKTLRDQRRSLPAWLLGIVALVATYAAVYPSVSKSNDYATIMQQMPEAYKALFTVGGGDLSTPTGYLNTELMTLMAPLLVLLYAITAGANSIAGEEDRHTAPRPVRRPALAAGRGVQPVAALPDQPGEPRHGFTSPAGHRACGNRPTVASLTAAGT